jgi:hypothetical protein
MAKRRLNERVAAASTPEELARLLLRTGSRLNADLQAKLLATGESAVPALLEIINDGELFLETGPGAGWAPIHAVKVLGGLRAQAAIPRMVELLAAADAMEIIFSTLIHALAEMGPAVVEPVLAARNTATGDGRSGLNEVLGKLGVKDERIFEALVAELETTDGDALIAAGALADYGDSRALPALSRRLDALPVDQSDSPFANQEIIELVEVIEELGGELTPAQLRRRARVHELREQWRSGLLGDPEEDEDEPPAMAAPRPGRNQLCWCGSGKKYKKCHEAADEGRGPASRSPLGTGGVGSQ